MFRGLRVRTRTTRRLLRRFDTGKAWLLYAKCPCGNIRSVSPYLLRICFAVYIEQESGPFALENPNEKTSHSILWLITAVGSCSKRSNAGSGKRAWRKSGIARSEEKTSEL